MGGTEACLNIAIVDDAVFESDHNFGIILTSASLPAVSVISPIFSTITIQDNDGKCNNISGISSIMF